MWQLLAKFQIILLHNGEDKINGKCEVKNFAARKKQMKILYDTVTYFKMGFICSTVW